MFLYLWLLDLSLIILFFILTDTINIIFRQTKGATYNFSVSSLNCVFSEVVRNFLKVHKDIDEDKIGAFLFNGERVQDYKTLKENNIKENDIILITEI